MRALNKALLCAVNKAAHAEAQAHYRATRARMLGEAERMLADGLPMASVVEASCARPPAHARESEPQR